MERRYTMILLVITLILTLEMVFIQAKDIYDMSRLEECGYSREQIMDNGDIIRVYVNPEGTVMGHTSCSLTLRSTDKDSKIKMEFVKFTTPNCNVSLWLSEDNVKSKPNICCGCQKNRLNETVLLSTQNICYKLWLFTCLESSEPFTSEADSIIIRLINDGTTTVNVTLDLRLTTISGPIATKPDSEDRHGLDANLIALFARIVIAVLVCLALVPIHKICFRDRRKTSTISYIKVDSLRNENSAATKTSVANRYTSLNDRTLLTTYDGDMEPLKNGTSDYQGPPPYGEASFCPPSYDDVVTKPIISSISVL